jgi:(S)-mandelate dehydrogenase
MFDYVDGAAGTEAAARLNMSALHEVRLQPRVLVNVEQRSVQKRIFGLDAGLPFGIAPMGMCNLTWPGADRMLAAQARLRNVPVCVSTAASSTLEEFRVRAGDLAWFQLYVSQSLESTFAMVGRAETAGYEVLILTVDVPQVAARYRDLRNGFQIPFKMGAKQFIDFALHPQWSLETLVKGTPKPMNFESASGGQGFQRLAGRGRTDWDFLARLRERWQGKLIVKGVLHPEDAVRIKKTGADAVYVSNHGGRQLGGASAAIHALRPIRQALGAEFPVLFDGGVRDGEGIVKALAYGADFVMLGRSILYAIGADGERGLSSMFDFLAAEIDATLAQLGRSTVEEIDARVLAPVAPPHN